jgi:hypothetical protein
MKKYYDILGLSEGASLEEIQVAYEQLSKELNPINNDDLSFFQKEYDKVQEAYNELNKYISNLEQIDHPKIINDNDNQNKSKETNKPSVMRKKNIAKKEIAFGIILFFIATGIWGIFLQNLGFFKNQEGIVDENKVQQVRVVNTVDVSGNVDADVSGSVSVDNTVDINLREILGRPAGARKSYAIDGQEYFSLDVSVQ